MSDLLPTIVGTWLIVWALIRLMTAQGLKYLSSPPDATCSSLLSVP